MRRLLPLVLYVVFALTLSYGLALAGHPVSVWLWRSLGVL